MGCRMDRMTHRELTTCASSSSRTVHRFIFVNNDTTCEQMNEHMHNMSIFERELEVCFNNKIIQECISCHVFDLPPCESCSSIMQMTFLVSSRRG